MSVCVLSHPFHCSRAPDVLSLGWRSSAEPSESALPSRHAQVASITLLWLRSLSAAHFPHSASSDSCVLSRGLYKARLPTPPGLNPTLPQGVPPAWTSLRSRSTLSLLALFRCCCSLAWTAGSPSLSQILSKDTCWPILVSF